MPLEFDTISDGGDIFHFLLYNKDQYKENIKTEIDKIKPIGYWGSDEIILSSVKDSIIANHAGVYIFIRAEN